MKVAELQARVDDWNAEHPKGTWVRVRWMRNGQVGYSVARTEGIAFVSDVGDPSYRYAGVYVDGFYTWRELDELTPLTEEEAAAAPGEEHCRPVDRLMGMSKELRAKQIASAVESAERSRREREAAEVFGDLPPAPVESCEVGDTAVAVGDGPKQLSLF